MWYVGSTAAIGFESTHGLVRSRSTVLEETPISIMKVLNTQKVTYCGTMVGSGGYRDEEEDSELMHDCLRSILSILTCIPNHGARAILCIPRPIAMNCKCRCLFALIIIVRVRPRSLDMLAANGTSSPRLLALAVMEVESTRLCPRSFGPWLRGRGKMSTPCLHVRMRVHVDQSHVGKLDFPTSTWGEACGLAYYLRL
jgi:hypothetical protein